MSSVLITICEYQQYMKIVCCSKRFIYTNKFERVCPVLRSWLIYWGHDLLKNRVGWKWDIYPYCLFIWDLKPFHNIDFLLLFYLVQVTKQKPHRSEACMKELTSNWYTLLSSSGLVVAGFHGGAEPSTTGPVQPIRHRHWSILTPYLLVRPNEQCHQRYSAWLPENRRGCQWATTKTTLYCTRAKGRVSL